jgi:wobble nucleotide-excising tRNase
MSRSNKEIETILTEILLTQKELKVLMLERTKQIDAIDNKLQALEKKVDDLEKVSSSGQTIIRVFTLLFSAALTFLVGYLLKVVR